MKKLWVCLLVFAGLLGLGGATAHAQTNDKIDVFVGYSFMPTASGNFNQNMNGYAVDATANLNSHFGIEANLNGSNGTENLVIPTTLVTERQNQDDYYYLFGPRVQTTFGKVTLFSHFLVGVANLRFSDQNTVTGTTLATANVSPFSAGLGGGADWNFGGGRFGWRVLELDYLFSRNPGVQSGQLNNVRLETGLVLHF